MRAAHDQQLRPTFQPAGLSPGHGLLPNGTFGSSGEHWYGIVFALIASDLQRRSCIRTESVQHQQRRHHFKSHYLMLTSLSPQTCSFDFGSGGCYGKEQAAVSLILAIFAAARTTEHDLTGHVQLKRFLQKNETKDMMGVPRSHNFSTVSWTVNTAFVESGDAFADTVPYLTALLERGKSSQVVLLVSSAPFPSS